MGACHSTHAPLYLPPSTHQGPHLLHTGAALDPGSCRVREARQRPQLGVDNWYFQLNRDGKEAVSDACCVLAAALPTRVAGHRFKHIFNICKRKRLHNFFLLCGPAGEWQ